MSLAIKEVAFICQPVADIERARNFYEKVLGLKSLVKVEIGPGQWWIEYDIAGFALAISNMEPPSGTSNMSIALEVDDLEKAAAAITAAGVPIIFGPVEFPPCNMFGVQSPDGHTILFHKKKA